MLSKYLRHSKLMVLVCLISVSGIAQEFSFKQKYEDINPRLVRIDSLRKRGIQLRSNGKDNEGDRLLKRAKDDYLQLEQDARNEGDWNLAFLSLLGQAETERRIDTLTTSLETTNRALDLLNKRLPTNTYLYFKAYSLKGKIYHRLTDYYKAADILDTAQIYYHKSDLYDSADYSNLLDYKYYAYQYGNISVDTLLKYLPVRLGFVEEDPFKKGFDPEAILYLRQDYVSIFRSSGNYDLALAYALSNYQYARQYVEKIQEKDFRSYEFSINELCQVLCLKREYDQALKIALPAYQRLLRERPNSVPYYNINFTLGKIYSGLNQPEKAIEHYSRVLNLEKNRLNQINFDIEESNARLRTGMNQLMLGEVKKARNNLTRALNSMKSLVQSPNSELLSTYEGLGDFHAELNEWYNALHYYDSALRNSALDYNSELLNFPNIDSLTRVSLVSLTLLNKKTKSIFEAYGKDEKRIGEVILDFVDQTHLQLARNRKDLYQSDGKLVLSRLFKGLYELGIASCYNLYDRTENVKFVQKAHQYMRYSKANLLQEQSKDYEELTISGIPYELKEAFFFSKQRLDSLKAQLYEFLEVSVTSDSVLEVNSEILRLQSQIDMLKDSISINYQDSQLNFDNSIMTDLKENQLLIEYFYGDEFIYAISGTNQSNYIFHRQSHDLKLEEELNEIVNWTSHPPDMENIIQGFEQYKRKAYSIFSKLVEPLISDYSGRDELIIIPDEYLTRLSFEALSQTIEGNSFKELDFLIKDYNIRYLFTSNKKSFHQFEVNNNNKILGIGYSQASPIDGARRSEFASLPGTEKEIQFLGANFDGNFYLGSQGTKERFLNNASDFEVLHLAVHGKADERNRFQSSLIFNGQDNILYPSQLYLANIRSRLAVLSACESGVGTIQKGEGTFSIARGFAIVGVPNIIMSLWEVNDGITSSQMVNFYHNYLSKGNSIQKSLRRVKLDFMDEKDSYFSHPYYWASFVHLGVGVDEESSNDANNGKRTFFVFGALLLISSLVFLLWYKKRKEI